MTPGLLRSPAELAAAPGSRLAGLAGEFAAVVDTPAFPCVFSSVPFATGELRFGLVPGSADPVEGQVVAGLRELCALVPDSPDMLAVLFVEQPGRPTLDDDFDLAGRIVRAVIRADEREHPGARRPGPDEPDWELWLAGVGLFVNFSSPRHTARRSRNVGPWFTVIAQERKSFERRGRGAPRVRERIRRRLGTYDDVPPHPNLGSFPDPDSREVLQFFLGDGSQPMDPSGCLRARA